MKTRKLYGENPYQTHFNAEIMKTAADENGYRIILDQTLFYPESGGQPGDRGKLESIPVLAVLEEDGFIIHLTPTLPSTPRICGEINWPRRFDHMQHHSGQHILSQALLQTVKAETVSFHLSERTASIDVDVRNLDPALLQPAEELANQVVFENQIIEALNLSPAESALLPWRTTLPADLQEIRGIRIGTFDLCGCGGTHVRSTGEIGIIRILKARPSRLGTRIEFACGYRALEDYREKTDQIQSLSHFLGVAESDLFEEVKRLDQDYRSSLKTQRSLLRSLDQMRADDLWQQAHSKGSLRTIVHVFPDLPQDRLKEMAMHLASRKNTIALLGTEYPKTAIVFARSADRNDSMVALLQNVLSPYSVRSGGNDLCAQGGGIQPEMVFSVLTHAEELLNQKNNRTL